MKQISSYALLFALLLCLTAGRRQTIVFLIGDSTAANKANPETNPERGWGMALQGCFDDHIHVDNHAVNGRSSKSFIDEGRWQRVLDLVKPGDYVLIQFGHNDEKPNPDLHTDPGTTFDANLARFVNETRAKGGHPVLLNAVVRRNFYRKTDHTVDDESLRKTIYSDEKINSDTLIDTHGAYLKSPRDVAKKMGVPFVDANRVTHDLEQSMGVVGPRKLHMWFKPGEQPGIPNGRQDNTHYNVYGAHCVANLLADAIAEQVPALRKHVRHYDYIVSARGFGNFMDLDEAVRAVPVGAKTKILILDGKWRKPVMPRGKRIRFVLFAGASLTAQ
ncbi:MAG: rhamnogalacturonan acetylesterase [Prevotella sp.]|nr:rhamnogalacturonan acetylesterase [Prevotella sp.]